MVGSWVGYVYTLLGCGTISFLLLGSTLLLYGVARLQRRRQPAPRIRVTALTRGPDDDDAA